MKINGEEGFLLFDGAMGTMLQEAGILSAGAIPELLNLSHPEEITKIHQKYIEAGCQVATTNTFGANEKKLSGCGASVEDVIRAAVRNAKNANPKYVALDIGPTGQLLAPMGTMSFEEAYDLFAEQVKIGADAGADLILCETFSDLLELKAAVLAAKEHSKLSVFATMSFMEDHRTFMGCDPAAAAVTLSGLGVDALGVNCSLGPAELLPVVKKLVEYSDVPVLVQANAGLPCECDGHTHYNVDPEEYAKSVEKLIDAGAAMLGGCCGTTPEYMARLADLIRKYQKPKEICRERKTVLCSATGIHVMDGHVTVIGERINPTGKKRLKEALRTHQMDYIVGEAIDQTKNGADVLDINVGLPELDEPAMMREVVDAVCAVSPLPLQIDSTDPKAIEAGVRRFAGIPIINSVNGKQEILDAVLPIAKKYGAVVLGLTLDEAGIPETPEGRLAIAERILKEAQRYGIPKEKVLIDCLVLTASAQQEQVMTTLLAVRMVKMQLGLKTVLGVSNVSFGLPNRPVFNSVFLAAALGAGLDAPIINPMSEEIMRTVRIFRVCNCEDPSAQDYIARFGQETAPKQTAESDRDLKSCILEGRAEEAAKKAAEMLSDQEPMRLVEEHFIPALNEVGKGFEEGRIFLPQLMQAASAVKAAFEVIRNFSAKSGLKPESRGKIVLATVKGDIHDIGKNIVKMMLENYGYTVYDLGRDVPPEEIVEAVQKYGAPLVGLSALMTTTVGAMQETIELLHTKKIPCRVMVGGAVLTEEYAKMVGADYYAKDAQQSVKIADRVFLQ